MIKMTTLEKKSDRTFSIPLWVSGLIPLIAIGLMLVIYAYGNPLALFTADLPPVEDITLERIRVVDGGFEVTVFNGAPEPVTVAQVLVDEAYWQFTVEPSPTLPRMGRANLSISYPWVENEPNEITLITSTGTTFSGEVPIAIPTPTPGAREFLAYGLLGIYVGVVPVGLGMLWYPAMRKMERKWLGAILALTVGLLVFLFIDTILEAFEVAAKLPGVFQGVPLVLFAALVAWFILLAVGARRRKTGVNDPARRAFYLALLIAIGIGLHNLGEGLAIGAAFALGEAALGGFLVIGFMLHNVTEGIGIVAPLVRPGDQAGPRLSTFLGLTLVAGLPAVAGAWVGGFAFSPILATLFLGIGAGAIWQVIVEVTELLKSYAEKEGESLFSWLNLGGFLAGLLVMYLTAFLVK
jgi:zinc transporter ZupT